MNLDRKIYLATAVAAVVIGSAVTWAVPRLTGDLAVHAADASAPPPAVSIRLARTAP